MASKAKIDAWKESYQCLLQSSKEDVPSFISNFAKAYQDGGLEVFSFYKKVGFMTLYFTYGFILAFLTGVFNDRSALRDFLNDISEALVTGNTTGRHLSASTKHMYITLLNHGGAMLTNWISEIFVSTALTS